MRIGIALYFLMVAAYLCAFTSSTGHGSGPSLSIEALRLLDREEVLFEPSNGATYIDSGKFSDVYAGTYNGTDVVVKVLKQPISAAKVSREIRILEQCCDIEGVIELLGVINEAKEQDDSLVALVFESVGKHHQWLSHRGWTPSKKQPSERDRMSSKDMTPNEVKMYIYKVLLCVQSLHRRGIMHRDIKPRNIIIDRLTRRLKIIDFGHAEVVMCGKQYSTRIASRHYKAPELLLNYVCYDSAVDIWACGCVLAGLIFRLEPFFYARPDPLNLKQLGSVCRTVGSDAVLDYCAKYGIRITEKMRRAIGHYRAVPLESFRSDDNTADDMAVDLCRGMLCVDHQERLTVEDALAHPYFDECREE